jgi:hypothetical protein
VVNFSFDFGFGGSKIGFIIKTGLLQLFPQQGMITVDMKNFYVLVGHDGKMKSKDSIY